MALGFVDAIGLIGTGLGIIQFGLDNFVPDQQDAKGTIVGIKGGDGSGASDTLVSVYLAYQTLLLSRHELTSTIRAARSRRSMPIIPRTRSLVLQTVRLWPAMPTT